jgi:DNA-binding LytR/AlgR family response regulator
MIIPAVDADSEDCEFFCDAVKEIDSVIVVMKARNGSDALHLFENHGATTRLYFPDVNVPRMDSRASLQAIKTNEKLKGIPHIMYSTHQ